MRGLGGTLSFNGSPPSITWRVSPVALEGVDIDCLNGDMTFCTRTPTMNTRADRVRSRYAGQLDGHHAPIGADAQGSLFEPTVLLRLGSASCPHFNLFDQDDEPGDSADPRCTWCLLNTHNPKADTPGCTTQAEGIRDQVVVDTGTPCTGSVHIPANRQVKVELVGGGGGGGGGGGYSYCGGSGTSVTGTITALGSA